MTALIIDDEYPITTYLEIVLKEELKIESQIANNGNDGLKLAKDFCPDIILLDIMMPGINGFEVCEKLKSDASTRAIPIIMITAMDEQESFEKAFNVGVSDFMRKPLSKYEVVARVSTHIRNYQLLRDLRESNNQYEAQVEEYRQITHRFKQTTEKLMKSEAKLRALYDNAIDAIFTMRDNIVVDCNNATLNLFKFKNKEDFIGRHPTGYSPEYQPDGMLSYQKSEQFIQETIKNGNKRFRWVYNDTAGIEFNAELTLTAMIIDGEQYVYAIMRKIE